jgi:hypothetical protein
MYIIKIFIYYGANGMWNKFELQYGSGLKIKFNTFYEFHVISILVYFNYHQIQYFFIVHIDARLLVTNFNIFKFFHENKL